MTRLTHTTFEENLELLPDDLAQRATALRPYLFGQLRSPLVEESVKFAFDAAYVGDVSAAADMLARAEAEARQLAAEERAGSTLTIIRRGLRGTVPVPAAGGRLLVATDASVKQVGKRKVARRAMGWGYVSAAGHWGCAGGLYGGALDPTGHNAVTIAELRGVHMALADLPAGPVTLLLDSRAAIEHLRVWQAGRTEVMPDGYSLRARLGGSGRPTLVMLAEAVAAHPDLRVEHVPGHGGHPGNEAADGLASLARRCAAGEQGGDAVLLTERAAGLAAAFLREWGKIGA